MIRCVNRARFALLGACQDFIYPLRCDFWTRELPPWNRSQKLIQETLDKLPKPLCLFLHQQNYTRSPRGDNQYQFPIRELTPVDEFRP